MEPIEANRVLVLRRDIWESIGREMRWIENDKVNFEFNERHDIAHVQLDVGKTLGLFRDDGHVVRIMDYEIVLD